MHPLASISALFVRKYFYSQYRKSVIFPGLFLGRRCPFFLFPAPRSCIILLHPTIKLEKAVNAWTIQISIGYSSVTVALRKEIFIFSWIEIVGLHICFEPFCKPRANIKFIGNCWFPEDAHCHWTSFLFDDSPRESLKKKQKPETKSIFSALEKSVVCCASMGSSYDVLPVPSPVYFAKCTININNRCGTGKSCRTAGT